MVHKAFEVIGKRIILDVKYRVEDRIERKIKGGIFQESEKFDTNLEGYIRPALDFIEPDYNPNSLIELSAKGRIPRERINPRNPILSIHFAIDPALLKYEGVERGTHKFKGILWYVEGMYINDGIPKSMINIESH
jgi:hypothetical protein